MISSATRRVIILTVPWHEQTELEIYLQGIWRMCCRGKVMDKKAVVELLCLLRLEEKQGSWGVIAAYVKLLWLSKMDELLGTWKGICTAFFTKRLTAPESLHITESTFCICSPQPIYKTSLSGCKLYWQKTYLEIISPGISSPSNIILRLLNSSQASSLQTTLYQIAPEQQNFMATLVMHCETESPGS